MDDSTSNSAPEAVVDSIVVESSAATPVIAEAPTTSVQVDTIHATESSPTTELTTTVTKEATVAPEEQPKQTTAAVILPHEPTDAPRCDVCSGSVTQTLQTSFHINSKTKVLYSCGRKACVVELKKGLLQYYAETDQVAFETVYDAIPSFFDANRSWTVRRADGTVEDGWKVVRNWRTIHSVNTFRKLKGEPWWRMPLYKGDKIRHSFVHELQELNKGLVADGVWAMLPQFLTESPAQPTAEFLKHYAAEAWELPHPTDAQLGEYAL